MSSSSRRRSSWLAAAAAVAVAVTGALAWSTAAGAASTLDVVAVRAAGDSVTMVVGVTPPPSLAQPGTFAVASGDAGKLPTRARSVIGPQLATGVVLDTSAAGAGALQGGVNGATNLLLQLPDGVRNLVVADGGDGPQTLSALAQGATQAIAALNSARAGGTRHTAAALDAAVSALPNEAGASRLLLLYTGAADAGGEPAAQLGARLAAAGVVLAVVTSGSDGGYWAQAAAPTGGLVVTSGGRELLGAFDRVAAQLRGRFVLSFPRPGTLPASVRVSVTVAGETAARTAVVPDTSAAPVAPPASEPGPPVLWWVLGAVVLVAAVVAGVLLVRRRGGRAEPGSPAPSGPVSGPLPAPSGPAGPAGPLPAPSGPVSEPLPPPSGPDGPEGPLPRRVPANGTSAIAARSAAGPAAEDAPEPMTDLAAEQQAAAVTWALGAPDRSHRSRRGTTPTRRPDRTPTPRDAAEERRPAPEAAAATAAAAAARADAPAKPAQAETTQAETTQGRATTQERATAPGPEAARDSEAAPSPGTASAAGAGPGGAAESATGTSTESAAKTAEESAEERARERREAAERLAAADRAAALAAERAGVGRLVGDPAGARAALEPPLRRPGTVRRRTPSPADDETTELPRPSPGDLRRQHPAADARAYSRLDEETGRVAAEVTAGRMEFRHAVARIAMAAPGRIDLLDRVIETERRLAGTQMGAAAPSETVLRLLTTARRVVAGEVALVGPAGVRVEQASSTLRLIHPDRTTRECRSATELARHVDLDSLSVDAPT